MLLKYYIKLLVFMITLVIILHKPLSHSHSRKYTENVSRDLSQDGLI